MEKKEKLFNFDLYGRRHIALMVCYAGWDYDGLVEQVVLASLISAQTAEVYSSTGDIE